MAKLTTANNAVTVLDGALSLSATTLVLTDISNFPVLVDVDDYCILTLIRASDGAIEYVKCTSQNVSNRSYEILRGQESTLALDFLSGDEARNLLTSDQIETLRTISDDKLPLAGGTLSGALDLGGNTLDNVKTAVNPDEGVNLQQVQDLVNTIPSNNETLLTSVDLTNGGANDLTNIDIVYNPVWDTYDYFKILVIDAVLNTSNRLGFVVFENSSPSTYITITGTNKEALLPHNTSVSIGSYNSMEITVGNNTTGSKSIKADFAINSDDIVSAGGGNGSKGYRYDYNGTTFTNLTVNSEYISYPVPTNKWTNHTIRFTTEGGNFTGGTLRLIGYKYPS